MLKENQDKSSQKLKSDNAYRTIGEVAKMTNVPQHVIRFWETKFSNIAPQKIKGRRYYLQKDIEQIQIIKDLLYNEGLTIKGVSQTLKTKNIIKDIPQDQFLHLPKDKNLSNHTIELKEILNLLKFCQKTLNEIF